MRKFKFDYLFVAIIVLAAAVLSAHAGPGCEQHEKKIEAIVLSASELEDGKVIEVGDGGELTMKQDGDSWTFTLTGEGGAEKSVFTIALDDEAAKCVKIVTTSEGDDVWTEVSTGEGHRLDGKHCAVFVGDEAGGDKGIICKKFESFHCGQVYRCEECGLVISVSKEKDKGAYTCPNDGTEMKKADSSQGAKRCYAYEIVSDGSDTESE